MYERGLRAKIKLYDDSDFFDNGFKSFNPDEFFKDQITDKEINDLFGVSEDNKNVLEENFDLDELIKYWNNALPPMVDYADMVGAPEWAYGCRYVYEDPDGYFIEGTISALKELKELRELIEGVTVQLEENNKKLANMIHLNNTMIIDEPYHMEIHNEKDAEYAIKNMCSNCYRLHYCTGAEAYKCNQIKEEIKQHFMETE